MTPTFLEIAGGRLAVSHRPQLRKIPALRDQGCTWVVSLLGQQEEPQAVAEAVRAAGLGWVWLELRDATAPQGSALRKLWRQVNALCNLLGAGESILIHCSAGQHRTGMVTYMVLRASGLDRSKALQVIDELRPATRIGLEQLAARFLEPDLPLDALVRIDEPGLFACVSVPDQTQGSHD